MKILFFIGFLFYRNVLFLIFFSFLFIYLFILFSIQFVQISTLRNFKNSKFKTKHKTKQNNNDKHKSFNNFIKNVCS